MAEESPAGPTGELAFGTTTSLEGLAGWTGTNRKERMRLTQLLARVVNWPLSFASMQDAPAIMRAVGDSTDASSDEAMQRNSQS